MVARRFAALTLAAALLLPTAAPARPVDTDKAARAVLPEFVEFLKLPNVTTASTADIRANAVWLEAALRRHGLAARQLADGETPMVYAETPADPKKPTILFYAHMDGQPVKAADWDQPSPFVPVLKSCRTLETCKTLPFDRLFGATIDPEWRLFARSAADDKAPILMMIAALDAMRAAGQAPAVNVKLLIDSHEEGGPPTLQDVVTRNLALLRADAVVMMDGPMHASNRPTVVFGHRGGGVMRLTVFGPRVAAHSGHYGNYAANPGQNLARLVATFKDADGRVTIPGFYDGATADFAGNKALTPVVDDEVALRTRLGIATAEKVGRDYRAAIARPSLNIIGLGAGSMGSLDQSIIPDKAVAAFDLRTVPGIAFDRQIGLVRAAVERQGYHLVTDTPTDAERARYPLIASLFARPFSDALFTAPDSTVGKWAIAGLSRPGAPAVTIPIMGGSVPSGPLVQGLKAPTILIPLVNADDNQHAPNENLRMGNFTDGVRSLVKLLATPL
jgi:acetylornithine deacetylase/succinyl-diaminopimelate desuccinylase-like protein